MASYCSEGRSRSETSGASGNKGEQRKWDHACGKKKAYLVTIKYVLEK